MGEDVKDVLAACAEYGIEDVDMPEEDEPLY